MSYDAIPEHTRRSIMLYVTHGYRPGTGLQHILSNNLFSAVACCDDATLAALRPIVTWIHSFAPSQCHGSREKMEKWVAGAFGLVSCYDTKEGLVKLGYPKEAANYSGAK